MHTAPYFLCIIIVAAAARVRTVGASKRLTLHIGQKSRCATKTCYTELAPHCIQQQHHSSCTNACLDLCAQGHRLHATWQPAVCCAQHHITLHHTTPQHTTPHYTTSHYTTAHHIAGHRLDLQHLGGQRCLCCAPHLRYLPMPDMTHPALSLPVSTPNRGLNWLTGQYTLLHSSRLRSGVLLVRRHGPPTGLQRHGHHPGRRVSMLVAGSSPGSMPWTSAAACRMWCVGLSACGAMGASALVVCGS
jgi:hypothetical protein